MPSVPADIIHFSKAVFHPITALCVLGSEYAASSDRIFNEINLEFPNGHGNIRVAGLRYQGISRLSTRCSLIQILAHKSSVFLSPALGDTYCAQDSHIISRYLADQGKSDPLRALDQALSRPLDLFVSSPALAEFDGINCSSLLWISLGIASPSPNILKRSAFYFRNQVCELLLAPHVVSAYKFFSIWPLSA
jgi:hypothetical protein